MGHRAWHNVVSPTFSVRGLHVGQCRFACLLGECVWQVYIANYVWGASKAVSCKQKGDFPIKKSCISR